MLKKRIAAFAVALTMLCAAFSFTSCSEVEDKTIGNAYVSIYVYNEKGGNVIKQDAIKVSPNEAHEYEWGKKLTPYLALETVCSKENKNKTLELLTDSTGGVSVEKIDKYASGTNEAGDAFYWALYINGELMENAESYILQNTDKIEFKYTEQTYRSINITASASNGAVIVLSDTAVFAAGEKTELTITNVLNYAAPDTKKVNKNELGITLSEDGKSITKIGEVEVDETHEWAVMINDVDIEDDIDVQLLKDADVIKFEYREIEAETDDATAGTDAVTEAE